MMIFIKYKDGSTKNYKIKDFTMVDSTICIITKDDVLYLDYFDIKNIQIIDLMGE